MLIRSLEQFLACAGCSSNVPYCSSPRSGSALMLLCQLLKSDKLSIFSIASQKATNSSATKLLISMVSFACLKVLFLCVRCADSPLLSSQCHSVSTLRRCTWSIFLPTFNSSITPKTLCQGNRPRRSWGASLQSSSPRDTSSWTPSWKHTGRVTQHRIHGKCVCWGQYRSAFWAAVLKCGL